jgi:hypothetical protein
MEKRPPEGVDLVEVRAQRSAGAEAGAGARARAGAGAGREWGREIVTFSSLPLTVPAGAPIG